MLFELKEKFNAYFLLHQLLIESIKSDYALHCLGFSLNKDVDFRHLATEAIADIEYDAKIYQKHQIVVLSSLKTVSIIIQLNQLKDDINHYLQELKKEFKTQSKHIVQRDKTIQLYLKSIGVSQLDLTKVYRHIICFDENQIPDAISYSMTARSRSMIRYKTKEVMKLIEESNLPIEMKDDYYYKLGKAEGNRTIFISSRSLSPHQVVNFRFPGEKKWKMIRTSLPVFLETDAMPSIRFYDKSFKESQSKITRMDNCLKEDHLLLPALNIYARTEIT